MKQEKYNKCSITKHKKKVNNISKFERMCRRNVIKTNTITVKQYTLW